MIKRSRIKLSSGDGIYHCVSRVVWAQRVWGDEEKEVLRRQLGRVAAFSGVEILTFCIMSNHFHVLIRVPDAAGQVMSDAELLRRYKILYPKPTRYERMRLEVLEEILTGGGLRAEALRRRLQTRMFDVSEFMKTLKQRFSIWYNRTHNRVGTHWEARFKSVLVQNSPRAIQTVAAYIDLNPVRAGLVEDPKDYRWCGYAEAVVGHLEAAKGIAYALGIRPTSCSQSNDATHEELEDVLMCYRILLFGRGYTQSRGKVQAVTLRQDEVRNVMKQGGKIPLHAILRCRLRHFTEGLILGTKEFVQNQTADRLQRGEIRRCPQYAMLSFEGHSGSGALAIGKRLREN